MNRMSKLVLSLSLAIGMASGVAVDTVHAAQAGGAGSLHQAEDRSGTLAPRQQAITFFLADPELGVAGVYRADGSEIYFEARRDEDALTGAPGALSLRFVDADGRTLALGGEPLDPRWVPGTREFTAAGAGADTRLLSGLSSALRSAHLHPVLSPEKSALVDLALQTAGVPATQLPVRAAVDSRLSVAAEVGQVASFYEEAGRALQVKRDRGNVLRADLGNGLVLQTTHQWVMEPDEYGRMGRIDAYSVVTARDGHVLSAEFGGDNVPAGWDAALDQVPTRDHVSLAADFGRAATALQALAYSGKASGSESPGVVHQAEHDAMQRMARSMVSSLLPERGPAPANAIAADVTISAAAPYQTMIEVHRKPFVVIAQHSGTRVVKYKWSGSTRRLTGTVTYCNHGTCPFGSGMSRKCTYTSPRMSWYRVPARNNTGTCATPYWATGRSGHHNCHDDSSVQVRAVRGLGYSVWSGRCGNIGFAAYAPACDGS